MSKTAKSLKVYFFQVLFFSLLVPFLFSLSLFLYFIIYSNSQIDLANKQLKRNIELEIIESLYRYQNAVQVILQSEELKFFLNSTIDSEQLNKEKLHKLILFKKASLAFPNSTWKVLSTRSKVIYGNKDERKIAETSLSKDIGITFDKKTNSINMLYPVSYKFANKLKDLEKNYGYILVAISVDDIKKKFPELIDLKSIGKDLDIKYLSISTIFEKQEKNSLIIIYLYTISSLLFIIVLSTIGYRIFKNKVIEKVLALKARVQNEIDHSYYAALNNELESLSHIIDYYLRYSKFLQNHMLQNSKLSAAGNLAHFIAHDLRKPFSKLRFFISEIKSFSSIMKLRNFVNEFELSLIESIDYVDHFLNEMMEGAIDKLDNISQVPVEEIIIGAFSQISLGNRKVEISFNYQLDNNLMLKVSRQRVVRVFINIVSNAFEAMNFKGNVWFNSKEKTLGSKLFLEICIGNSNSVISAHELEKIFEPFYTRNKANGTGLGLAIAKKLVLLHGGEMKCFSLPSKGVEFVFSLPAERSRYNKNLYQLPALFKSAGSEKSSSENNLSFENKKCAIIVDDDPLILRSWKRALKNMNVITFLYPENLFEYFILHPDIITDIEFIISDYLFGDYSVMNFQEYIKKLRKSYQGVIFLSSDFNSIDENLLNELKLTKIEKKFYTYEQLKNKASSN